jgi:hypothetical protein
LEWRYISPLNAVQSNSGYTRTKSRVEGLLGEGSERRCRESESNGSIERPRESRAKQTYLKERYAIGARITRDNPDIDGEGRGIGSVGSAF